MSADPLARLEHKLGQLLVAGVLVSAVLLAAFAAVSWATSPPARCARNGCSTRD